MTQAKVCRKAHEQDLEDERVSTDTREKMHSYEMRQSKHSWYVFRMKKFIMDT